MQWPGTDKGVADKIVWVSGLQDLKRGEASNKGFVRKWVM